MSGLTVLAIVVAIVALVDVIRRPNSQWVAADRNRFTWIVVIAFFNFVGVVFYLILVVPRFVSSAGATDDTFRKNT